MKRGNIYAAPLMTNQEIGSLHANINTLTLHPTNLNAFNRATLKNTRNASNKPIAAGELLITRSPSDGSVTVYFNIQSGTFSEPLLKCHVTSLAQQRGINKKTLKNVSPLLKMECRDKMVEQIIQTMMDVTTLSSDHIRFLGCDESIQHELEGIPFLQNGKYDFGPCRDDDDYFESLAGRNLIRRFTMYTSAQDRNRLNRFFNHNGTFSSATVLGRRPKLNVTNQNHTRQNRLNKHNYQTKRHKLNKKIN